MTDERGDLKAELFTGHLRAYIEAHAQSPHPYLSTIREQCRDHKWNFMLTTADQAAFLYSQALLIGARKVLELGSYFGHSTLALAAALPSDGLLISIEHNPKFASKAREHLQAAGVADRVQIQVGEAPLLLQDIIQQHAAGTFDLIFVDADKRNFELYWETSLRLLRKNGLMIFDNVLARGKILETSPDTPDHVEIVRNFNQMAVHDPRVFSYIATLADGMMVAVKK